MLIVVYGNDTEKGRAKMHELGHSLLKKRPEALLFTLTPDSWEPSLLPFYIGGQGLFESKYIVYIDSVCSDAFYKKEVVKELKAMSDSENAFIVFEEKLDAKTKALFEKHAYKMYAYEGKKKASERFNTFALADALMAQNKEKLWVLFEQAIRAGISPEEIHGVLSWKVRTTSALQKNKHAYGKALTSLYISSRRGKGDLGTLLELFILTY